MDAASARGVSATSLAPDSGNLNGVLLERNLINLLSGSA